MADLTADALEGQSGEPGAATPSSEANQKGAKGKESSQKVDLTQSDEFKKFVAERDRREAQYQQQLAQQQHYTAQLQQQMDALADKDLDDYGKLTKQIERAQARETQLLHEIRQRDEAQAQQAAKYNDLTKLATKFQLTSEQYEKLWKAKDPDEALDLARDFRDANRSQREADEEERRESNRVDVGGGRASTSQTRKESTEREAWDSGDPQAFIKARLAAKKK